MPGRYADYLPSDGFTALNTVSTIGSFTLGFSMITFIWKVFRSYRYGEVVSVDDPWGYGNSLEWATTCPPPRHNFYELPRIPFRATRIRTAPPPHDRTHACRIPHRLGRTTRCSRGTHTSRTETGLGGWCRMGSAEALSRWIGGPVMGVGGGW